MKAKEKIVYLANLVLISWVDGKMRDAEGVAIESIRQEIGASKEDLKTAIEIVASKKHQMSPMGRFSDRIRNLEDILSVAIADGEISKSEKPEILNYAKSIKVSQDQISEILSECKVRIQQKDSPMVCSTCSKPIPFSSKFCPLCGADLQEK